MEQSTYNYEKQLHKLQVSNLLLGNNRLLHKYSPPREWYMYYSILWTIYLPANVSNFSFLIPLSL